MSFYLKKCCFLSDVYPCLLLLFRRINLLLAASLSRASTFFLWIRKRRFKSRVRRSIFALVALVLELVVELETVVVVAVVVVASVVVVVVSLGIK